MGFQRCTYARCARYVRYARYARYARCARFSTELRDENKRGKDAAISTRARGRKAVSYKESLTVESRSQSGTQAIERKIG